VLAFAHEYALYEEKFDILIGIDEVGRGCVAGPVYAAATCFSLKSSELLEDFEALKLKDSKLLSEKKRTHLFDELIKNSIKDLGFSYELAFCSEEEIDRINILKASHLCMWKALEKILKKHKNKKALVLVDGHIVPDQMKELKNYVGTKVRAIIKGDNKSFAIAAAALLAKVTRDDLMKDLALKNPEYLWHKNKGYPTKEHKLAIAEFGITQHHRKTFKMSL